MSLSQSILRGCTKAMTLQPRIINSMPFQRKLDVYVCDQTRCSRSFSSKVVVSQTRSSNAEIKSISADKSASGMTFLYLFFLSVSLLSASQSVSPLDTFPLTLLFIWSNSFAL